MGIDFEIKFKEGKNNKVVDALSHFPIITKLDKIFVSVSTR